MGWNVRRYGRQLEPGQRSALCVFDIERGETRVIISTDVLVEAPNWTPDGRSLLVNAGGELWLLNASSDGEADPMRLETAPLNSFNNDHLISADGQTVYASCDDGHIYALPMTGGEPQQVSGNPPHHCYLHGISPDGLTLVYVGLEKVQGKVRTNLFLLSVTSGQSRQLTDLDLPHDGPEFSPDGSWIYFNSERASPGQSQCFRMRPDGTAIEQLTRDERVNWFPHPSPDGKAIVYLSYPPSTRGHPANRDVILRLMDPDGSNGRDLIGIRGGQGTINVNSWAPDSRRFAYVAYLPASA